MTRASVARLIVGSAIGIATLVVAATISFFRDGNPWRPTPPDPPSESQLRSVAARFPAFRDTLELILVAEREGLHRRLQRNRMRDSLLAAGDTAQARRVDEQDIAPAAQPSDQFLPPPQGQNIAVSDSLIYVTAWASRGKGFSASHWYAGYAYASRPPDDSSVWPASNGPSGLGLPYPCRYEHLEGPWYLFSMRDPWGEGGD